MDRIAKYHHDAPLEATGSIQNLKEMYEKIRSDPMLQTDVLRNIFSFHTNNKKDDKSFDSVHIALLDYIGSINIYLCKIKIYVNQVILEKTEKKADFTSLLTFFNDIETFNQKILKIPEYISKFNQENESKSNFVGGKIPIDFKFAIESQRMWLIYQTNYIITHIEQIIRIYSLILTPH